MAAMNFFIVALRIGRWSARRAAATAKASFEAPAAGGAAADERRDDWREFIGRIGPGRIGMAFGESNKVPSARKNGLDVERPTP